MTKDVMITEIVTLTHPAFDQIKADGATNEEINGLLDMKAVKIVLADTVSKTLMLPALESSWRSRNTRLKKNAEKLG